MANKGLSEIIIRQANNMKNYEITEEKADRIKNPSKYCDHQHYDSGERVGPAGPDVSATPFNFCPWCGKDLRKEKSNEPSSKTIDR